MRIRAARVPLAFVLAAALAAAGAAGPHAAARVVSRPAAGVAASPLSAAAAGLHGLHGLAGLHGRHGHERAATVDVLLAPATLLAMLLLVPVVLGRLRSPARLATSAAHARGPPAGR
jgi:hypothetical protein